MLSLQFRFNYKKRSSTFLKSRFGIQQVKGVSYMAPNLNVVVFCLANVGIHDFLIVILITHCLQPTLLLTKVDKVA